MMVSVAARPVFSLAELDSPRLGLAALDNPTFTTAREWGEWGYERGLAGLDLDATQPLPHPFFTAAVGGWRAGRDEAAERALLLAGPTDEELAAEAEWENADVEAGPMGYEELAGLLDEAADYYGRQSGTLAAMLAHLIRTGAGDVRYYRANNPGDFTAREAEMIETLQRCEYCERQNWEAKQ